MGKVCELAMDNRKKIEYNHRTDLRQYDLFMQMSIRLFSTVAGNVIFEKNSYQIGIKLPASMTSNFL